MKKNRHQQFISFLLLAWVLPTMVQAAKDEQVWNTVLKNQFFAGKTIHESNDIITLDVPYRAEDPAMVPLRITSKIPQSAERFIKKITLFIDKNPYPFAGEFEFTPANGQADLALRVRVNTYSYIRAVAELNDGQLYMVKKFVKASGGCSAPIGADLDAAMQRLGKMKFRLDGGVHKGKPTRVQLLISHPNITGMQMDQVSRIIRPSNFIEKVQVFFDNQPILTAKTDIAISADPNFRFYFVPKKSGELRAEFTDTSCESPTSRAVCKPGKSYSKTFDVRL